MINQMETHVFFQQKQARPYLEKFGTKLMASMPLAQGKNNLFTNEVLTEIGKKYNKTAAQVNLRFLLQSDVIVIPKSTSIDRMKQNFDLFDFALTEKEMKQIERLDLGQSLFVDRTAPDAVENFISTKNMNV